MKHSYDELMSIIADVESDNAFEGMSETLKERIYSALRQEVELTISNDIIPPYVVCDSIPLIFMVNGIKYYGYYSRDGFFYPRGNKPNIPFLLARHPKTKSPNGKDMSNVPIISSWEYA